MRSSCNADSPIASTVGPGYAVGTDVTVTDSLVRNGDTSASIQTDASRSRHASRDVVAEFVTNTIPTPTARSVSIPSAAPGIPVADLYTVTSRSMIAASTVVGSLIQGRILAWARHGLAGI